MSHIIYAFIKHTAEVLGTSGVCLKLFIDVNDKCYQFYL